MRHRSKSEVEIWESVANLITGGTSRLIADSFHAKVASNWDGYGGDSQKAVDAPSWRVVSVGCRDSGVCAACGSGDSASSGWAGGVSSRLCVGTAVAAAVEAMGDADAPASQSEERVKGGGRAREEYGRGLGGQGIEAFSIDGQRGMTFVGKGCGKGGGFAEFVAGDGREDEPIVPVTTGLLDGLEGAG